MPRQRKERPLRLQPPVELDEALGYVAAGQVLWDPTLGVSGAFRWASGRMPPALLIALCAARQANQLRVDRDRLSVVALTDEGRAVLAGAAKRRGAA